MSKVVRIVNLREDLTEPELKTVIQQRVRLMGEIKEIYIRQYDGSDRTRTYAYVIFELNSDALRTVHSLHGILIDYKILDLALIGPGQNYTKYEEKTEEEETVNKPRKAGTLGQYLRRRQEGRMRIGVHHVGRRRVVLEPRSNDRNLPEFEDLFDEFG